MLAATVTAVSILFLLEAWRFHRWLSRAIGGVAWPLTLDSYPSVTVVRPIKGLDAGARENIAAAFDTGYPGPVELLFVFDDESEPALPLVREAIEAHRANPRAPSARVLFSGDPPAGRTGKLHAMIAGLHEARHELIAFADSDIRPDRRALTLLVETLMAAPEVGSAFAPVVVPIEARTVGDAGYSLLLNGLYGPAAAAATLRNGGELPFIMGQFMIFKRRAIAAIGGLESAEGQLVDDMYLGARIKAAGLRNRVSPHSVPIIQEGLPLGEFWKTYLRWITFSRSGLPGRSFKWSSWMHGISFWSGLVCAVLALVTGHPIAAALAALVPLGVSASINRLHRKLGGAPLGVRFSWVAVALLLVAPIVMLSALLRRRVEWRGRSYSLDAGARLATGQVVRSDDPSPRAA